MPILIDAEKLKREIKSLCNPYGKPSIGFEDGKKMLDLIDRQPTVEAVPVRHGRWVQVTDEDHKVMAIHECSECGNAVNMPKDYHDPFCLYCGAKMDEGVTK